MNNRGNPLDDARSLIEAGQIRAAISMLAGTLPAASPEQSDELAALLMYCYTVTGRTDLARRVAEGRALPPIALELLRVASTEGDVELADQASKALQPSPAENDEVHFLLGQMWLCRFDYMGAEREYRQAALLKDSNRNLLYWACSLAMLKRTDEALALVRQADSRDSYDIDSLVRKARVLRLCNQTAEARKACDDALALGEDLSALIQSAVLWMKLGNYQSALADLDRALTKAPNNGDGLSARAMCLAALGKRNAAISDLRTLVANQPRNLPAWLRLLQMSLRALRLRDALTAAKRAMEIIKSQEGYVSFSGRARVKRRMEMSRLVSVRSRPALIIHFSGLEEGSGDHCESSATNWP